MIISRALLPKVLPQRRPTACPDAFNIRAFKSPENRFFHLYDAQMPGVMHEIHVLKPLERHGQDQSFHVLVRVPAFGENAGTFLSCFTLLYPMLIEGCEFLNDILDAGLSPLIHVIQKRQDKDGFV